MRKAVLVTRILLGLIFFISGLNIILHFLPQPPMAGDAGAFATLLGTTHYITVVGLLQIIAGLLLLVGRYVPLGLVILAPILVNILLFHVLMNPQGIAVGLVATLLELFLLWVYRRSFRSLFDAAPEVA